MDADESPGQLGGIGIFAPEAELIQLNPPGKLIFIPVVLVIFWAFLLAYARRVLKQDTTGNGLLDPEQSQPPNGTPSSTAANTTVWSLNPPCAGI